MKNIFVLMLMSFIVSISTAHSQSKTLNIVFIPKSSDQVFWKFMRDGVDDAIGEDGNVALTWRGPTYNDDVDSQISILRLYSRQNVDAIIIAPTDRTRLIEPIRNAAQLGIKIVIVDSAVDSDQYQNFVTTDNYAGGRLAAKTLSELLNAHGRVVVYRTIAGSASTDDRALGFIDYIKENSPDINIVADEYGGGSRGKSLHSATELLKKKTDINGIFAVNESSSDGMLRALRQAGLAGEVKFVGFDSTDFLLEGLDKNEIHGLIVQNPRKMGYVATKAAIQAARGTPVAEKQIYTDATVVTRNNRQAPEIQQLLIP